ncbi:hypothetical protein, partial [Halomonas ventosae]|uniref:hypothetical protein n=1 Tax=Halomonas ventosae TaxID=229007 RepID=UPI001AAD09CD
AWRGPYRFGHQQGKVMRVGGTICFDDLRTYSFGVDTCGGIALSSSREVTRRTAVEISCAEAFSVGIGAPPLYECDLRHALLGVEAEGGVLPELDGVLDLGLGYELRVERGGSGSLEPEGTVERRQ